LATLENRSALKNKVEVDVLFLGAPQARSTCSRLPRISPQSFHKNTTQNNRFFQNTPQKAQQNPQKLRLTSP
jgi:hypothetical protein